MKRLLVICLCTLLLLSCAAPAFAADADLVYDRNSTLSASFVRYGNITVKSGASLTITRGSGFEITGVLTVEPGASLLCDGEPGGQFNFSMRGRGAAIVGIPLYYVSRDDGSVKPVEGGWKTIAALDAWDWDGGWCPAFKWNTQVGGWCLTQQMQDAVMGTRIYHSERDRDTAERFTETLHMLGLFAGAGTNPDGSIDYALYRSGTRTEALVMLIRLLGKEKEALSGTWSHPFADVPKWADKYVGYAYETGLTDGVSATRFGADGEASMQMYLTFLLRALGQTGDDVWPEAFSRADAAGITGTENDSYELCPDSFWRCDMVVASYRALEAACTSGQKLAEKLIAEGVFTADQYQTARR